MYAIEHDTRGATQRRTAGLLGTVGVMAAVGLGLTLMKYEGVELVPPPPPLQMVTEVIPDVVEPEPIKAEQVESPPLDSTLPPIEIPDIIVETPIENPVIVPMVENPAPATVPEPAASPVVAAGPPATRPKLRGGQKPEYPPSAQRAGESGTTMLNLCVAASGRVTQASISGSSGSKALDDAALRWIKNERFTPGTQNGQAVDMCNHNMSYVWELPRN